MRALHVKSVTLLLAVLTGMTPVSFLTISIAFVVVYLFSPRIFLHQNNCRNR